MNRMVAAKLNRRPLYGLLLVLVLPLASGEALSAPTVVLPAGEEAGVRSAIGPGEIFEFAVRVEPSPEVASWRSRVVADGQILDRSAGAVRLAKGSP